MTRKLLALCCVALAAGAAGCGGGGRGDDGGAPAPIIPDGLLHPIDGNIDFGALSPVHQTTLQFTSSVTGAPGAVTTLRWATDNDDVDFYLALEWDDDTFDNGFSFVSAPGAVDAVHVLFDSDGDGVFSTGEDARLLFAASSGSQYIDQHSSPTDWNDMVGDGYGRMRYDAVAHKYRAEFLIPISADGSGQDAGIVAATRFNVVLWDGLDLTAQTGNNAFLAGNGLNSSGWPAVGLQSAPAIVRPGLPDDLTGLIVLVSDHESPKGEIYTFDPATRVLHRVTYDDLYEDCVSLSHDRSRIVFQSAPDKSAWASFEVFTINADGSGLTQLTSNATFDGQPVWSPDDGRILYVSFQTGDASLMVMTDSGAPLANLTPPGFNDNDPDWMPDGRIAFKTDRFSALPHAQIAVMHEDGTNVTRVTQTPGGSDHDPCGRNGFILFERFPRNTAYETDPEAPFTPWAILEASDDGSSVVPLISNGWVNWLPVYDPTGQYFCFLKSCGYTDARLATRAGIDRGRLIPDVTRIRFIDWK